MHTCLMCLWLTEGENSTVCSLEALLARYECTKKTRPPAKARFGSVCERLFGTANTQFIHNLRGNTQMTQHVRQVTKEVDPKGQAVWPLKELQEQLARYFYEIGRAHV